MKSSLRGILALVGGYVAWVVAFWIPILGLPMVLIGGLIGRRIGGPSRISVAELSS